MELNKEDQATIALIDERLKHWGLIKSKDVEVVCIKDYYNEECGYTKGIIYMLSDVEDDGFKTGNYNFKRVFSFDLSLATINQQHTAKDEVVEDVKERWLPSYGSKYWYIGINDGLFFVSDFHWGNDDVDFTNRETGNCFKTKEIAKSAADKIKQLLQTI